MFFVESNMVNQILGKFHYALDAFIWWPQTHNGDSTLDCSLLPSFSLLTFSPSRSKANTHTPFLYRYRSMCSTPFLCKTTDSNPRSSGDISTYLKRGFIGVFQPLQQPQYETGRLKRSAWGLYSQIVKEVKILWQAPFGVLNSPRPLTQGFRNQGARQITPNIALGVNKLQRWAATPRPEDVDASEQLNRYVKGTMDPGILLDKTREMGLTEYVDACEIRKALRLSSITIQDAH